MAVLQSDPLVQGLRLLRPRMPRLALAVVCGVLSLGSALALAAVSAWLITRAWQMPPILDLSVAVVAVRTFGISRGVLSYCERLASHDTALRAAGSARVQIYRRLARGPVEVPATLSEGDLVGRVGHDVDELSDALVRAVLPIAVATVLSVAAVVILALISPAAALVLAVCLAVSGVLAPWLSARGAAAQEHTARSHHADRDITAMTILDHAPELRVSGQLPRLIVDAAESQRNWGHALDRAARPAAIGAAIPTAAMGVSLLGAVVIGIEMSTTLAPTTLAILMLLPLSSFEAVTALPAAAVQLTRSRIAARRLLVLTPSEASDVDDTQFLSPTADLTLTARATAGHSGGGHTVDVDLVLRPGDRMTVLGPSGCGKTTVLMTLAGLLAPRSGRVDIGGVPLDRLAEDDLRAHVVFFAEDAHIFATTVRDNLLVVRGDCTDTELLAALDRVGLRDWLSRLPDGLSTVLTGGPEALSAGQRRRLLLARVLLSTAPIVLLDEPTEHLDAAASDSLLRALLSGDLIGEHRTVVVATHHLPSDVDPVCLRLQSASGRPATGTLAGGPATRTDGERIS